MRALYLALILIIATVTANAEIYIEPYVGYQLGTESGSATISGLSGKIDNDLTGASFGGKLGLEFLETFAFGADYMTGTLKAKPESGPSEDTTYNDLGPFVSLDLPFLKLSATAIIDAKAKADSGETADGSGVKAGIGFSILLVAINVDYIKTSHEYKKSGDSSKWDRETYMLGLSVPLSF